MSDALGSFLHSEEEPSSQVATVQSEQGDKLAADIVDEGNNGAEKTKQVIPRTPEELSEALMAFNYTREMSEVHTYIEKLIVEKRNPSKEAATAEALNTELTNNLNTARQTEAQHKQLLSEVEASLQQEGNENNSELLLSKTVLENRIVVTQNAITDIFTYSLPDSLLVATLLDQGSIVETIIQHYKLDEAEAAALRQNVAEQEAREKTAAEEPEAPNEPAAPDSEEPTSETLRTLIEANPSIKDALTFWQKTKLLSKLAATFAFDQTSELVYDPSTTSLEDFLNLLLHGPQALNRGYNSRINREPGEDGSIEVKSHEFKARFKDTGLVGKTLKGCIEKFNGNDNIKGWLSRDGVQDKLYTVGESGDPAAIAELFSSFQAHVEGYTPGSQDSVWNDFNVIFTSQLCSNGERKEKLNEEGMQWLKESVDEDAKALKRFWGVSAEAKKDVQTTSATPQTPASVPAPGPVPAPAPGPQTQG